MEPLDTEAAFYSVGLRLGVHSVEDVQSWADREMRRLDRPPRHLFKLLSGESPSTREMLERFAAFPFHDDHQFARRVTAG